MNASESKLDLVDRFFSGTGATYDFIATLCTFGFDLWWKRKILEKIPGGPEKIIDQACGTGILTFKIAQRFPGCRVIGVELREEYLRIAQKRAVAIGTDNIEFVLGRAEDVVFEEEFDCITSSYLAKYADLDTLIANAKRMLRPGGRLIMHDFAYPTNPIYIRIWEGCFKVMRALGARKYPEWKTVFFELPVLLQQTRWLTELVGVLKANSFSDISLEVLTFGTSAIVSARKK